MLLASEKGNCCTARWTDASTTALYLDAAFVLECLAPAALHVDRFLPPMPIRVAVDHRGQDATALLQSQPLFDAATAEFGRALLNRADLRDRLLPKLAERVTQLAKAQVPALVTAASERVSTTLGPEVARLRDLQRVNCLVRDEEIAALVDQQRALTEAVANARLRIDCVRLVHRGPHR